jgi:hypothetical protein
VPPPPPAIAFEREDSPDEVKALRPVRQMVDSAWPALLSALSFYLSTNLDDALFEGTLHGLASFTKTCGILDLPTPRDAFLTSLCRFAVPPAAAQGETANLGLRNLACLKAVIDVANALAGSIGKAWLLVFECLQNAEALLRKSPPDADALFQTSQDLDPEAFAAFVGALCRLDGEMIGMPVTETGALDLDAVRGQRVLQRRASTINVVRTLVRFGGLAQDDVADQRVCRNPVRRRSLASVA